MTDLTVLDVSAGLRHLEPAHVTNRLLGACQRVFYRLLESIRRRANQLNFFVNMVRHVAIFPEEATENNKKRAPHEQCNRAGARVAEQKQVAPQPGALFCG